MRTILAITLLALLLPNAFAQDKAAAIAAKSACGPGDVYFDVKIDKAQHPTPKPDSGKALVYFVGGGNGLIRVGLDGSWVGAVQRFCYFFVAVEPGEHHICADWQSHSDKPYSEFTKLANFTAEAGKVYYFNSTVLAFAVPGHIVNLDQVNSD